MDLAFTTLGNDGRMPMTDDHHCSECTKPYKPRATEDPAIAENAAPVKMAVMDGIVIGPVVSFFIIILNSIYNLISSIVHLEAVLMICKMLVENHFVRHTKLFMETGAINISLTISIFIKSNFDVILLSVWHSL